MQFIPQIAMYRNGCVKVAWRRGCMRILLSFAAADCKSYWSDCIQAATVICQKIVVILALVIPFKIPFKKCFKIVFFCFGVEIHPVLELQFPTSLHIVLGDLQLILRRSCF